MRARLLVCVAVLLGAARVAAQEPAKFFDDNCSPCHAIGGPPGAAPDLKDISKRREHAWLVQFILNPEEAARTDAAAAALVKQYDGVMMPHTDGATPETIDALLRYIDASSGAPAAAAAAPVVARVATASDVDAGRAWYEGRQRLARGGPACAGCHRLESLPRLGGGSLGPDLTQAARRLGGTAGLNKWLGNPPTRVMRALFRDRPLNDDEALALAAVLAAEGEHAGAAAPRRTGWFAASGAAVALVALGGMAAIWSRRLRSVRRRMVAAARKETP
jgi:mono/diheme cytochrome c family protein